MTEDKIKLPAPGSYEALEMGCRCPFYDNNKGWGSDYGKGLFWINKDCPIHGGEEKATKEEVKETTQSLMEKLRTTYGKGEGQWPTAVTVRDTL